MTALRSEWIDALNREHVLEVAHALQLEVRLPKGQSSGGSFSCPSCNAQRRHPKQRDPRLACGVRREGSGWRCYECDAHGDQLHLVAIALEGKRWDELDGHRKARVREWVVAFTGGTTPASTATRPRLAVVAGDAVPEYPPPDEVLELWQSCADVRGDKRIATWLRYERGLDVEAIGARELAVALPYGAACPGWAGRPAIPAEGDEPAQPARPWSESAYRCLLPMFDAHGNLRNLLARYAGTLKSERAPKSKAAHGFARRGLVLADELGRKLLRGELDVGIGCPPLRVVIAEGEMDMLAFATASEPVDELVAVLAIVSGSWTQELAERIPVACTALVATHHDEDGIRYANRITADLVQRGVRVERWKP